MVGASPNAFFPSRTISGQLMATLSNWCDQNANLRLLRPSLPRIDRLCFDSRHSRRGRQLQRLLHRCRGAGACAAWWRASSGLKPLLGIVAGAAWDLPQLQRDKEEVSLYKQMHRIK